MLMRKIRMLRRSVGCWKMAEAVCKLNNLSSLGQVRGISSLGKDFFFRQLYDNVSSTYTYLLADLWLKKAVIIDPVLEHADRDTLLVRQLGFDLVYAMNTHMHADHITGTGKLKSNLPGVKSVISLASGARADMHINDGDELEFGTQKIKCLATPGHTNGCFTFVLDRQCMAFTGDAVLIRGCGRTDFQEGHSKTLYESVHKKIFSLPGHYTLYPAHDYNGHTATTVAEEKCFNPRLSRTLDEFIDIMNNLKLPYPAMMDKALPANKVCGVY